MQNDQVSDVVIEGGAERIGEPLRVLNHFIESLIALLDQRIVLLDLRVFLVHVQLQALLLALQLHDLLVEVGHLHALLHHFRVDLVPPVSKFVNFALQLVEVVKICHCSFY